jgi:hypothetical protein
MDISSVSSSSLDDQVIQSLSPSLGQAQPSTDTTSSASTFSNVLQTLQSNDLISNNNLAMLQALQGAQTSATASTASSSATGTTANALQQLQETNTESNDIYMLQSLQTNYSSSLSDLLQNIQNTEDTGDNQQMLDALQAAASGSNQTTSNADDVLNSLLQPATDSSDDAESDPILNSLVPSTPDTTDASSIFQDTSGTDTSDYAASPDDAVLQALLQTDTNGGDFASTLQALQNNQNTTPSNTQQVSS